MTRGIIFLLVYCILLKKMSKSDDSKIKLNGHIITEHFEIIFKKFVPEAHDWQSSTIADQDAIDDQVLTLTETIGILNEQKDKKFEISEENLNSRDFSKSKDFSVHLQKYFKILDVYYIFFIEIMIKKISEPEHDEQVLFESLHTNYDKFKENIKSKILLEYGKTIEGKPLDDKNSIIDYYDKIIKEYHDAVVKDVSSKSSGGKRRKSSKKSSKKRSTKKSKKRSKKSTKKRSTKKRSTKK